MGTPFVLGLGFALVAFAFVAAAPAAADDPGAISTASMSPTCKIDGAAPTVTCAMSAPPECRTG